jgi:cysteine desulfurase
VFSKLFPADVQEFQIDTADLGVARYVNLDNAATTPPFKAVEEGVSAFLRSYGSVHRGAGTKSQRSTDTYERSRDVIKRFVNAPADSYVLYCGNTTAAMNTAAHFFSFLEGKVAVSAIEHSSSWLPWVKAEGERRSGSGQMSLTDMTRFAEDVQKLGREQVIQYDVNEKFEFDLGHIEEVLKQHKVKAFVLTASSNATGYCPPIGEIGELVHRYGAMFIVDACQYLQHHSLDMQALGVDFLAASGHKFYAPYGGGFLIGPKAFLDKFLPYQIGGGNLPYITSQGEFLRYETQLAHDPGTPNAVGAVAMAIALEELEKLGMENVERYEATLAERAYDYLASNRRVKLHVNRKHLSSVLSFSVEGLSPRWVASELNRRFGVGTRAGSFCVYNVVRHLLHIDDVEDQRIAERVRAGNTSAVPGFVRASISLANNQADIDRFISAMEAITRVS